MCRREFKGLKQEAKRSNGHIGNLPLVAGELSGLSTNKRNDKKKITASVFTNDKSLNNFRP